MFPFTAVVGQEELKLALIACAIDPSIGGVLAFGDRGTGKSTIVRSLAALLPPIDVVAGDPYNLPPAPAGGQAKSGAKASTKATAKANAKSAVGTPPRAIKIPVPVVDLPLGATEDRIVGALDLERALTQGIKTFEPGLLARANRGFLYIDEVNLLEDHLVDLLLDVAASGENVVEREGLSVRHPARFVLIGSGNPEEGELRPQLLDRFGLSVEVRTPTDLPTRIEVVKRRDAYERDPAGFTAHWEKETAKLRTRIAKAQERVHDVASDDALLETAAKLCQQLGTDGLRAELTLLRVARAVAAYAGAKKVELSHLRQLAPAALRHRLRRDPLDEASASSRVERAIQELLGT
ncbi:MAG: magnesium chelatase ATPase subunit I [Burkholderiales bacterium]|nr:magnesium chelatase ATPase subunit I [Burkholderiales bacterium]